MTTSPTELLVASIEDLAAARDDVREAARAAGLADRSDDVALVVSELVTNGLQHGSGAPVRLLVLRSPYSFEVAVESTVAHQQPVVAAELPDPAQARGRGLYIARSLADTFTLFEDDSTVRVSCSFQLAA